MNTKEWWQRFRFMYRKYGIQRQELIEQSQIEPAQWSRLERGDGSPTDDMIQKIKNTLRHIFVAKKIEIPKEFRELTDAVDSHLSTQDIKRIFEAHFRREIGYKYRGMTSDHISFETKERVVRNCETIAMGADPGSRQQVNFPQICEDFLGDGPKNILWYPSAGEDVRPLFFFSEAFNQLVRSQRTTTKGYPVKPDLFLFTSLCHNQRYWPSRLLDERMFHLLSNSNGMPLYEDNRSTIHILDHQSIFLDRQKHPFVKGYATFGQDPREHHHPDGYWIELELTSKCYDGVKEPLKLLYLFHENIHFWDSWVVGSGLFHRDRFRLQSLVCSREGLGLGGCERSSLTYWLEMPLDLKREFSPEYIVAFSDFTNTELRKTATRDGFQLMDLGPYIPEEGGHLMDVVYHVQWNK